MITTRTTHPRITTENDENSCVFILSQDFLQREILQFLHTDDGVRLLSTCTRLRHTCPVGIKDHFRIMISTIRKLESLFPMGRQLNEIVHLQTIIDSLEKDVSSLTLAGCSPLQQKANELVLEILFINPFLAHGFCTDSKTKELLNVLREDLPHAMNTAEQFSQLLSPKPIYDSFRPQEFIKALLCENRVDEAIPLFKSMLWRHYMKIRTSRDSSYRPNPIMELSKIEHAYLMYQIMEGLISKQQIPEALEFLHWLMVDSEISIYNVMLVNYDLKQNELSHSRDSNSNITRIMHHLITHDSETQEIVAQGNNEKIYQHLEDKLHLPPGRDSLCLLSMARAIAMANLPEQAESLMNAFPGVPTEEHLNYARESIARNLLTLNRFPDAFAKACAITYPLLREHATDDLRTALRQRDTSTLSWSQFAELKYWAFLGGKL